MSTDIQTRKRPAKRRPSCSFKSPLPDAYNKDKHIRDNTSPERLKNEIQQLKEKIKSVQENINSLTNSGYKVTELKLHMDKMHEYNEIKDTGQMVLGRIAELDGVRTKDLYKTYGLDLDD